MKQENYAVCSLDGLQNYVISPPLWQKNCEDKHILLRYLAIPLQENEQVLWLGLDDESNLSACEIFSFLSHKKIEPVLISSQDLKYLFAQLNPDSSQLNDTVETQEVYQINQTEQYDDPNDPVIRLMNSLFTFALQQTASDIHFEPLHQQLNIRLRIDGVLQLYRTVPSHFSQRLISRLKLLAKLDIGESRLPQDGQFQFKTELGEVLDFRVSSLPTNYGEKIVLRLQKNKPVKLDFSVLGLNKQQKQTLINALNQPQGLILVTGPTGSGKSITLYSALNYLNSPEKHILTAEDPIEISLDGIIQTQVNRAIELDFNRLLRTFLRQDPDIIMLGEIRDEESAQMTLRAAQTGHLVLSTLHTNDAPSAVERLQQLGIKDYEIANSLLLVVAQRLVRRICPACKGKGCDNCFQGYKGRIGVYQLFSKMGESFEKQTACLDFLTLAESAKQKVAEGLTDSAEMMRVFGNV